MVANLLKNHSSMYSHFVSQPIHSDNAHADTEPPSVVDEFISNINDPDLHSELTCEQYITRLRNGAWGDHIAISISRWERAILWLSQLLTLGKFSITLYQQKLSTQLYRTLQLSR